MTPFKLAEKIKVNRIKQKELAQRMGLCESTLSRVLNVKQPMTEKMAIRIEVHINAILNERIS